MTERHGTVVQRTTLVSSNLKWSQNMFFKTVSRLRRRQYPVIHTERLW